MTGNRFKQFFTTVLRPERLTPVAQAKQHIMVKSLIIKILITAFFLLFILSLINRKPNVDDAWLGEHAFWQEKLGYVKSELMHGITSVEDRLLCHHKLFTLHGALFINFFGYSLSTLKSVSLVYLVIFICLYYFNTTRKIFSRQDFLVALLLLISNSLIFEFSFVYRPEIAVMTLGFISWLFIEKALKNDRLYFSALSGLFAGLCFSTHLNGIIFFIAGYILLLWNKKFRQSFIFGLSALAGILVYFYDFTQEYNFSFWLEQIKQSPSLDHLTGSSFAGKYIINILNEHMRFFHGPAEVTFSVLLITSLFFAHKHLHAHINLQRYTILLVVFLALFSVHKTSKYIILYLPYLITLMTLSFKNIFDNGELSVINSGKSLVKYMRHFTVVFTLIYIAVNSYYDINITSEKFNASENRNLVKTYIGNETDELSVIAPMTFIFNEILNFRSIQSELCYSELQKSDKTIYQEGLLKLAIKNGIDYIILSEEFINKFGINNLSYSDFTRNNFEVVFQDNNLIILKYNNHNLSHFNFSI